MIIFFVLISLGLLLYSYYFYKKQSRENASAANYNRDYALGIAEQLEEKDNLVTLLTMTLIRVHGAKKAAVLYYHMLENNPSNITTPTKKALYKKYNLPVQYADYLGLVAIVLADTNKKWNEEEVQRKIKQYDKMLLRSLVTEFENLEEAMKADYEREQEMLANRD